MFALFALTSLTLAAFAIRNNKVSREYDVKGNVLFAHYTIEFSLEDADKLPNTYVFGSEFPIQHLSTISFTLDGNEIYPKFDEEFLSPFLTCSNYYFSL